MSIINDIQSVKTISSTSTQGVITTSNSNFKYLANALYKFLTDISYSESDLSMSVNSIISATMQSNGTIIVKNDSGNVITLDANGKIFAKNAIKSNLSIEAPLVRIDYISSTPKYGTGGEIVYARTSDGDFDFLGYVNGKGWVSLTSGESVSPSPVDDGDNLESWSASVESIITELPSSKETDKKYIVSSSATGSLAENAGKIVFYDDLSSSWQYVEPENGAFAIVKDEGNAVYTASVSDTEITWVAPSTSLKIGEDTNGYNSFSADDTISYAIKVFDDEIYDIYDEALAAFNNAQGIGYCGADSSEYVSSKIKTDAESIYADSVEDNCEKVKFALTKISDGVYKISDEDKSVLISPAYGESYEAKILKGTSYISGDYFIEYNSGIVFFKSEPETEPDTLEGYKYTGEFLSDKLGLSINVNPDKNMKVSSDVPYANFSSTGLKTSIEYKGYISVYVNGIMASVYDSLSSSDKKDYDCYFSIDGGTTPISYIDTTVEKGAVLYWNSVTAGYSIDAEDTISFIYE